MKLLTSKSVLGCRRRTRDHSPPKTRTLCIWGVFAWRSSSPLFASAYKWHLDLLCN